MNITDFLAGIPVNAALRERIATLLEDKNRLEKKVEALEKEKADLVKMVGQLREELAKHRTPPDSVEHRGVLFKGVSKGTDGVQVYCIACGIPLSTSPEPDRQFICNRCDFIADFNRNGLSHVLSELPRP